VFREGRAEPLPGDAGTGKGDSMGLFTDRLKGQYKSHTIEVEAYTVGFTFVGLMQVKIKLIIDNEVMDTIEVTGLPGSWSLRGSIPDESEKRAVVVEVRQPVFWVARFRLLIDGVEHSLTKVT
jgi:hypothetical protein